MRAWLLLAPLLTSCAATVEDVGRYVFPNRLYVEANHGDFENQGVGPDYEDATWTVGLSWDLMPSQVRVLPDEAPRAWYEPPPPPDQITVDEEGNLILPAGIVATLASLLGGGFLLRRRLTPSKDSA
ncbi:MAG: hypothetical protein ACYTG6_09565 [Planctomycetota bacterium]